MKIPAALCVLPCIAVLCALGSPPAAAQALYGSIVGDVNDASGAVVAGARVTLTGIDTKQSREAVTNESGGYDFPTLPPGTYELKVQREGFNSSTQTGIAVVANNTVRVDVTLNVGAVTKSITVSGAAATLQTDRSEVRHELNSNQLVNLPVAAGRNYQTLFVTLPGFGGIQASYNSTPSKSVESAGVQRQRLQLQHQQHAHRRRAVHQSLAAA